MFDMDALIGLVERTKSQDIDHAAVQRLDQILGTCADLVAARSLAEHAAIQDLVGDLRTKIENDRTALLTNRGLGQVERLNAMDRIELYGSLVERFDPESVELRMEAVRQEVEAISRHIASMQAV